MLSMALVSAGPVKKPPLGPAEVVDGATCSAAGWVGGGAGASVAGAG